MARTARLTTAALVAATVLATLATGCTSASAPTSSPTPSGSGGSSSTPTASASRTATPTPATAAPLPAARACYDYHYAGAVAPVARGRAVPCTKTHTAITFGVGRLDDVVDGHLLSVDSDRIRAQVADRCPAAFASFVGGTTDQRRLTMLRPVWFTPSLQQSDHGADWYRCDAIAIAADQQLAPLVGRLEGVLDRPEARQHYAMCGTAEPGTPSFHRVICSAPHSWRALSTVDVAGAAHGRYPGVTQARAAGQQTCQDAARAVATDPLNYQWGYEWPTAAQWQAGQKYGLCWTPS